MTLHDTYRITITTRDGQRRTDTFDHYATAYTRWTAIRDMLPHYPYAVTSLTLDRITPRGAICRMLGYFKEQRRLPTRLRSV